MSANETYAIHPVGHVRAGDDGFRLEIDEPYRDALLGLEDFSHVVVLWWAHELDNDEARAVTVCDQPYRNAPEKLGIFATRSPLRPNPVVVTPAWIAGIDRETGVVAIPFIDAEDGTPILDLKPYHPCADRIRDVEVPAWCDHWPKWVEDNADFDWAAEFVNAQ